MERIKPIKNISILFLIGVLFSGCSSVPQVDTVATSVAATVAAHPTSTPIPSNTPSPTNTPVLNIIPTLVSSPTNPLVPEPSCSEEWHLVDTVPESGKGVFVTSICADTAQKDLIGISIIIPTGTPDTMLDEAFQYVQFVTSTWGWDVDDVYAIFQQKTKVCTTEFATSGDLSGFCQQVGQESRIITWTNVVK